MSGIALQATPNGVIQDGFGNVKSGRQFHVYQRGTTTHVTVYTDGTLTSTLSNPVTSQSDGSLPGYTDGSVETDYVDVLTAERVQGLTIEVISSNPVFTTAVTKEAPVNVMHPDFGALLNDSHDDTTAINLAITHALTAGRSGGVGELFIPGGVAKVTDLLDMQAALNLHIYGEGPGASVIKQYTDNKPIFQTSATTGTYNCTIEKLRLRWVNQQTEASQPNSVAVRLYNTNTNGFYNWKIADVWSDQGTYFIQSAPTPPGSNTIAFWNNLVQRVKLESYSGSLIKNSSTAVGMPTNHVDRLTSTGGTTPPTTTGTALALGPGGEWLFTSLDIEDWTDQLLNATGQSNVAIHGMHVERHRLVTGSVKAFNIDGSSFDIRGVVGSWRRNGTGPYYLYSPTNGAAGYIGSLQNFDDAAETGSGTVRTFTFGNTSSVTIGPRISHSANIVDWLASESAMLTNLISDNGAPPVWDSSVALPTASSALRGRMFNVKGTNATTADTLQQCLQSVSGTYSWKTIVTG